MFNAVLNPSLVIVHTKIILISAVLEHMRALQRDKKSQLCQEKIMGHIVIHLKIRVSDEHDEKH